MDLINIVDYVINAIKSVVNFIGTMVSVITELFSVLFVSFPSFITVGLSFVFSLGIVILIIKLVR